MQANLKNQQDEIADAMKDIKMKIVVLSGKGGVGKSTVASNLSLALTKKFPGKVGIVDLDFSGPNIAKMLGVENFTLPNTSYPSLIHMKGQINRLEQEDWTKELVWELDGANIRINTVDQQYPFHYNNKDFAKTLNEYYDKLLAST